MGKVFVFDAAKCNGCRNCQIACKDEHVDNDWSPWSRPQPDTGHFWCRIEERVRGQVPKVRVSYVMHRCQHCENAPCMAAAPEAVYRREDGLVIVDPEKAAGRRELVEACPYGAIFWNEELAIPQKCTGCAHLVDAGEAPHCVDVCPHGALRFGDEEDLAAEIAASEALVPGRAGADRPRARCWRPRPTSSATSGSTRWAQPAGACTRRPRATSRACWRPRPWTRTATWARSSCTGPKRKPRVEGRAARPRPSTLRRTR